MPDWETVEEVEAAAIEARALNKVYGQRPIVRNVSFQVRPGEVYALVGPNGAGKTTVIRLVSGLAYPTSGTVRLLGADPFAQPEVRRRLGAVVEAPAAFYPYLSGRANLLLHARLAKGVAHHRVNDLLELMELSNAAERKVGVYSLGMRQRLGVAAALLTEPAVLILDEPASGMDPLSLHLVHRVLRHAAQSGTAVLLSTHHLDEVVAYCSKVGILEEGALIDEINLDMRRDRYRVRVSNATAAQVALTTQPFIKEATARGNDVVFVLSESDGLERIAPTLSEAGVSLFELSQDTFDLRAYYRERLEARSLRPTKRGLGPSGAEEVRASPELRAEKAGQAAVQAPVDSLPHNDDRVGDGGRQPADPQAEADLQQQSPAKPGAQIAQGEAETRDKAPSESAPEGR